MTIRALTDEIELLTKRRDRLRQDIAAQQRVLESIRGRVAVARRDKVVEAEADFDEQLADLSPYLAEKHANLIARLRAELPQHAESGEPIDLRAIVRRAQAER